MHTLRNYLATIQNEDRDLFDTVLSRISHQSNIRPGNRLSTIIPMAEKTTYEVAISEEEASVLALSCPGMYVYYSDNAREEFIIDYINECTNL